MSSRPASKTSPASIIFRIGLIIMILAIASVALVVNQPGEGSIFTGLFLVLIGIFVIPIAAIILLTSGLLGSAELVQAKRAKQHAPSTAAVENGEDGSGPAR